MSSFEKIKKEIEAEIEKINTDEMSEGDAFEKLIIILEEKYGYEVTEGDLSKDGKYVSDGKYEELYDCVYHLVIEDIDFIFDDVSCSRQGSYHTDYYYNNVSFGNIITKDEYLLKPVFVFSYKNNEIKCLKGNKAYLNNIKYESIEDAINSIEN